MLEYYNLDFSLPTLEKLFEKHNLKKRKAGEVLPKVLRELYDKHGPNPERIAKDLPRRILFYSIGTDSVRKYIHELNLPIHINPENRSTGGTPRFVGKKPVGGRLALSEVAEGAHKPYNPQIHY